MHVPPLSSLLFLYPNLPSHFPHHQHHPLSPPLTLFQTFPQTASETMAKLGKLTKLKSAIKRWPSLSKLSRNSSCVSAASTESSSKPSEELHAVYVGKSHRRYLVNSDVIDHPLFQELVDRSLSSSSSAGFDDGVVVACEVVLFEHLLWMLESAETQLGSMDELVEFYTC